MGIPTNDDPVPSRVIIRNEITMARDDYYSELARLRRHIQSSLPPVHIGTHQVIRVIDDELQRISEQNGNHHNRDNNLEQVIPITRIRRIRFSWVFRLLRFLFLDLSLLVLFILTLSTLFANHMFKHFYYPMMMSAKWRETDRLDHEFTYYDRRCDDSDVSAASAYDFTMNDLSTTNEAVRAMMTHGVVKLPSVLDDNVSLALRSYILKRNVALLSNERIPLDGPDNRWSFAIGVNDDPSISAAVKMISGNHLLRNLLETLLGPNPAVVEITAITAAFGAESQGWHPDVKPLASSVKYSQTFTHSYSLFIPLQNTTAMMGATEVCPGTHFCSNSLTDTCSRVGFQVAGDDEDSWWTSGDAILMNQCTWHRGYAHTDENGQERVVFILTFISRPKPGIDHRQLSHGTYFHIRPDMYGTTLNDLFSPESIRFTQPLRWLRSLGIWAPSPNHFGWDWPTTASLRIANSENGYQYRDLVHFTKQLNMLPRFLLGEISEDEGWIGFIQFSLKRFQDASLLIYGCFLVIYGFLTIIVPFSLGTRTNTGFSVFLQTTATTHLPIIAVYFIIKSFASRTPWAQSIASGNIFRPFPDRYGFIESEAVQTIPSRWDVLIGTRYDATYLNAYNDYLNFHPGNRLWLESTSNYCEYFQTFSKEIQSLILFSILDKVTKQGGRFLSQTEDGTWTILDVEQSMTEIFKRIMFDHDSAQASILDEIRYLYADARYSNRLLQLSRSMKEQALARLQMIERKLFSKDYMSRIIFKRNVGPLPSKMFQTMEIRPLYLSPTLGRKRFYNLSTISDAMAEEGFYVVGELVEVNYLNQGRWFHGLVSSEEEDGYVDIVYLDNDIETVRWESIRKYHPIVTGSTVQTYIRDCNECPLKWLVGVVKKVYPDNTFDIIVSDELVMNRIPLVRIVK